MDQNKKVTLLLAHRACHDDVSRPSSHSKVYVNSHLDDYLSTSPHAI